MGTDVEVLVCLGDEGGEFVGSHFAAGEAVAFEETFGGFFCEFYLGWVVSGVV